MRFEWEDAKRVRFKKSQPHLKLSISGALKAFTGYLFREDHELWPVVELTGSQRSHLRSEPLAFHHHGGQDSRKGTPAKGSERAPRRELRISGKGPGPEERATGPVGRGGGPSWFLALALVTPLIMGLDLLLSLRPSTFNFFKMGTRRKKPPVAHNVKMTSKGIKCYQKFVFIATNDNFIIKQIPLFLKNSRGGSQRVEDGAVRDARRYEMIRQPSAP